MRYGKEIKVESKELLKYDNAASYKSSNNNDKHPTQKDSKQGSTLGLLITKRTQVTRPASVKITFSVSRGKWVIVTGKFRTTVSWKTLKYGIKLSKGVASIKKKNFTWLDKNDSERELEKVDDEVREEGGRWGPLTFIKKKEWITERKVATRRSRWRRWQENGRGGWRKRQGEQELEWAVYVVLWEERDR